MIQRLLAETDGAATAGTIASVTGDGVQAEASAADLHSGETYIGYDRATGFASFVRPDVPAVYRTPPALPLNRWSLAGRWNIGGEFASLEDLSGRIAYRFHARDLHLVLAPSVPNHPIRFRITLDGGPPGDDHGVDVDADGWGSVRDGRLYQLVRQMGAVADRTFEIEFFDAGVRAYGFTFG
jgi:hypothetical protein